MHKLLAQQIKRHLVPGQKFPEGWQEFLEAIDHAYTENDEDYDLLERAMDLTSNELLEKNTRLTQEIEQRKHAEKKLIMAKDRAQEAVKAKSDFLSRVGHELRTPLNSILAYARMLAQNDEENLKPSQQENTQHIIRAGNHLLALINALLDFSRIESGRLQVRLQSVNLQQMNQEAITLLAPLAQKKGLQIINNISKHPTTYVQADPIRLKQVFHNLISNAIKYNRPNGSITLDLKRNPEETIQVKIKDTGPGIAEDKLKHLFEPFNRMVPDESGEEGSGMGLAITKKMIELMEGSIAVESEVGVGSCFSIELQAKPNAEPDRKTVERKPAPVFKKPSNPSMKTLLYVEDNPVNVELVSQILATLPFIDFKSAPDAETGIELARTYRPHIILMDINLPGMDGITALKKLRTFEETKEIPALALSSNARQSDIDNALDAGFETYVTKPFHLESFLSTIKKMLDNHKPAKPV